MLFRTELILPPSEFKIKHNQLIVLLGSCFSQNIGDRLQKYKFKSISNPFGTIFHPVAISKLIDYICENRSVREDEMHLSQGIFVHPDFHSSLGNTNIQYAKDLINETVTSLHHQIQKCEYLFITLGTSIGYRLKTSGELVANCHKLHEDLFTKEVVPTQESLNYLSKSLATLSGINNTIKVIFTVSPVRHIKDGIIENARSKARLLNLVEQLLESNPNVSYFPAFEFMMDDLRDYRYYGADLIHPNEQAIDYIWGKFEEHYFDKETSVLNKKIEKINKAISHRPFNPESEEHQSFLRNIMSEKILLQNEYDWLDFNEAIK